MEGEQGQAQTQPEHGTNGVAPHGGPPLEQAAQSKTPQPATIHEPENLQAPQRRELTSHKVNVANEQLKIEVMDEPGSGGANHHYLITGFDSGSNASDPFKKRHGAPAQHSTVLFQNGPIGEVGVNGVTHEALLAIVEDRLRAFQEGKFACQENGIALRHVQEAMKCLRARTNRRMQQGTEGTHQGT